MRGVWRSIRLFWLELHAMERAGIKLGLSIGAFVIIMGVIGDARGWWDSHPFVLNVMSSFAAFSVGAPLAFGLFGRMEQKVKARIDGRNVCIASARTLLNIISTNDTMNLLFSVAGPGSFPQLVDNMRELERHGYCWRADWFVITEAYKRKARDFGDPASPTKPEQFEAIKAGFSGDSMKAFRAAYAACARRELLYLDQWIAVGHPRQKRGEVLPTIASLRRGPLSKVFHR